MSLFDKLYPSGSAFPSSDRVLPSDFIPESFSVPSGWEGFREAMNAAFFQYNQAFQGMQAAGGRQFDYAQCGSDEHLSCGGTYQVRFISRDFENFNVLFDEIVEFPSSSLAAPDSNQFLSWEPGANSFVASSFGGGGGNDCTVCNLANAIYNLPNNPKRDGDVSQINVCLPSSRLLQPAVIPTSPAAVTTATGFTNLIAQINGTNTALPPNRVVEQVVGTATFVGVRQEIRVNVRYISANEDVGGTVDVFPCNGNVGVLCGTIFGEIETIQFGVGIAPGAQGECDCAQEINGIRQAIEEQTAKLEEMRAIQFDIARVLIRALPRATFWAFSFKTLIDVIGRGFSQLSHSAVAVAKVLVFREGDSRVFEGSPALGWLSPVNVRRLRAIDLNEPAQGQVEPYSDEDIEILQHEPPSVARGELEFSGLSPRRDAVTLIQIPVNASVIRNGDGSLRYKAGNVRYVRQSAGQPDIVGQVQFISMTNQVVSSDVPGATGLLLNPEPGFEFSTNQVQ